jgi:hypothetical protein
VKRIFLLCITLLGLSGCAPNDDLIAGAVEQTVAIESTKLAFEDQLVITPEATYTAFPTYTPQATFTPEIQVTPLSTLTPDTWPLITSSITPSIKPEETANDITNGNQCGDKFVFNLYDHFLTLALGPRAQSARGKFLVTRFVITSLNNTTIYGIDSKSFKINGNTPEKTRVYHPMPNLSKFMNYGSSGESAFKLPWDPRTAYPPLVAIKSVLVFDVYLNDSAQVMVFSPSQYSDCQVKVTIAKTQR